MDGQDGPGRRNWERVYSAPFFKSIALAWSKEVSYLQNQLKLKGRSGLVLPKAIYSMIRHLLFLQGLPWPAETGREAREKRPRSHDAASHPR